MGALARNNTTYDNPFGGGGAGGYGGGGGSGTANNSYYTGANSPVNSSGYSGVASSAKATNTYTSSTQAVASIPSASGSQIGTMMTSNGQTSALVSGLSLASEASPKLASASGGNGDNTGYKYYTEAERQALSDEMKQMVKKAEDFQRFAQQQQEGKTKLEEDLKSNKDGIGHSPGQSLPKVLSDNTKSLTTALNSLTSSINDQFSLLNNNMMGVLIYFDQFLSNQTRGVNSLSEIPKGLQKMNIPEIKIPEIKIPEIKIPEIKIPQIKIPEIKMPEVKIPEIKVPEIKIPETKIDFSPLSNSLDKLVQNDTFKKLVEVQEKSKDNAKEFFDKKVEEADHSIESYQYAKKPQDVKDLDGQPVGTFTPREAALANNSTMARKTTDLNNDKLEQEDIDIISPLDISSIYGFKDCDSVCKALINQFKDGAP